MLKQYVIGDTTAKELLKILTFSEPAWSVERNANFIRDFVAELKCQVE